MRTKLAILTALAGALTLLTAAVLPRKAPDLTMKLADGKTITLSKYRGHVVVMTFILTNCAHCQAAVKVLNKIQNEYGFRGVQVLVSAINEDAPAMMPLFMRDFTPPYPVGFTTRDVAGSFIQPTGKIPQMPLMAFIDRQGMIRAQTEGEEPFFQDLEGNLRKQVEALLK